MWMHGGIDGGVDGSVDGGVDDGDVNVDKGSLMRLAI